MRPGAAIDVGARVGGRYRLERRLGKGGTAVVYEVTDEPTGRRLALKLFAQETEPGATLRFRREFHTMARLHHPRIVTVYDYGISDGVPYYTMELLDGGDLREGVPLAPRRAGLLLRDLASALAYVHSRRFVHRDVSPANVRCTGDGRAKLMDFGVLTTPGICKDVVGTPPLVAPELLRGLPIDHRADLFSFGGLAYWLLTGKRAFPARDFGELESLWARGIEPPSALVPSLPEALDELVLALLSLDPSARPRSAAEVLDRLGGALDLDPAPELEVAQSYLTSTVLVGRKREVEKIRSRIADATHGAGGLVLLEGPSGIGKSRLLREARLEAQTAGIKALAAHCESRGGAYSTIRQLVAELSTAVPQVASAAARKRDPLVARAVPELANQLGAPAAGRPSAAAVDERVTIQRELTRWFVDVSRQQAFVITVDDVQRCDEASVAVLAALSRLAGKHSLLCICGLRTDDPVRVPMAIAALRDIGSTLQIGGLAAADTEELIHTTFGVIPHTARLAKWLFRMTGGNPLHCTALPRQLVEQGTIRYVDGSWSIDEGFDERVLPQFLTDAMDERIAALPAHARAFAETLSVHGGELPLDLCVELANSEDEAFTALDSLLHDEILEGGGSSYRFRHDGIREALLRNLGDERRAQLHLRVGRALEALGDLEREGEVGWHLLHGGDESRAAVLLERAGRRLYALDAPADAMPMLEAALEVYERRRASPRVCMELRSMLLHGGAMVNRQLVLRHADATLDRYLRYAGVGVAARLGPWIGRRLALAAGIVFAGARWLLTGRRARGPSPVAAVRALFMAAAFANTAGSTTWPVSRLRRVASLLAPVAISDKRLSYASALISMNHAELRLGRLATTRRNAERALVALTADDKTPIAPLERMSAFAVCHWTRAMMALWRGEPEYFEAVAELERTPTRIADAGRLQLQVLYHRLRGEEEDARQEERQLEMHMLETGSGWPFRAALIFYSASIYGFLGDAMGLKGTIEELVRMSTEGFDADFFVALAKGHYYRERGKLAVSEVHLRRALELTTDEHIRNRSAALIALSDTLLALGEYERAKEAALEGLRLDEDPELGILLARVRGVRALAYAEAMLGEPDRAWGRLDALHQALETVDNPAARGMVEEARAHLSLVRNDPPAYREAAAAALRWFRMTGNSALLGRLRRLPDPSAADALDPIDRDAETLVQTVVSAHISAGTCDSLDAISHSNHGPRERASRVLDILLQASSGSAGFLYVRRKGALKLAAAIPTAEPPVGLRDTLRKLLDAQGKADQRHDADALPSGWHAVVLSASSPEGSRSPMAVAAIRETALAFEPPDPTLVHGAAHLLLHDGAEQ